jgi:hypothetical protein
VADMSPILWVLVGVIAGAAMMFTIAVIVFRRAVDDITTKLLG